MKIKNIAKLVTKTAAQFTASAATSALLENLMPEPENEIDEIKFTAGQYGLSMAAGYGAGMAVEAQFDEVWDASADLINHVKSIKKNNN